MTYETEELGIWFTLGTVTVSTGIKLYNKYRENKKMLQIARTKARSIKEIRAIDNKIREAEAEIQKYAKIIQDAKREKQTKGITTGLAVAGASLIGLAIASFT